MASLLDFLGGLNKRREDQIFSPMQRFGMGLDALILPEARMGDSIREQAIAQYQENKEKDQRNRTVEYLKGLPGGAAFAGAIDAGVPINQVYAAYLAAQRGDYVVVGNTLVDRATGKPVFSDKSGSGSMAGFTYTDAAGNTIRIGTPDLNQDKSNALTFGRRVQKANDILAGVELAGTDFFQNALNFVPFGAGRFLQNENFKSYDDARRDFVNAILRRESGAAIAESEFESANKQYFPVPGDKQRQIDEKRQRREQAAMLLIAASGPEGAAFNAQLDQLASQLNPLYNNKDLYDEERKRLKKEQANQSSNGNTIEN